MCPVENAHFAFARVPMPLRAFLFKHFSVGDLLVLLQGLRRGVVCQFCFMMPVEIERFDLRSRTVTIFEHRSLFGFRRWSHALSCRADGSARCLQRDRLRKTRAQHKFSFQFRFPLSHPQVM